MASFNAIMQKRREADRLINAALERLGDLVGLPVPELYPRKPPLQRELALAVRQEAIASYLMAVAAALEGQKASPKARQTKRKAEAATGD